MRFITADLERNLVLIWIKKAIRCKDINKNNALGVIQNVCVFNTLQQCKKRIGKPSIAFRTIGFVL